MILQIYRDRILAGQEATFRTIEEDAARICVARGCPHPHIAVESLRQPTEVWWLNAYESEAQREQVFAAYGRNAALMAALNEILERKKGVVAVPEEVFATYSPELSVGAESWPCNARFFVITTDSPRRPDALVFEAPDARRYVFHPARELSVAQAIASERGALYAVRPYWGMPAPEWIAADPEFWSVNPAARSVLR